MSCYYCSATAVEDECRELRAKVAELERKLAVAKASIESRRSPAPPCVVLGDAMVAEARAYIKKLWGET